MVQKIKHSNLDADVLTGGTELAEAANNSDTVLVHDASASTLKKIQVSNLTAQAGDGLAKTGSTLAVDVNGETTLETAIASGDFLLVYDSSSGNLRKVSQTNLLNFPTVSSVSPTNALSGDGTGNHTFTITGSGFTASSASLINDSGSTIAFSSVTVDSDTQITGVIAKSSLPNSGEPYDVKVTAASGLASTLANQINVDAQPVFSTAAGTLATVADADRASFSDITIFASDPESGGDVTYTLESGSLPSGLTGTSESSGFRISGTPDAVGSHTTSTFTIRAKDVNSNTSDREYSIIIQSPVTQTFTSSGTFSVPSGVSSVDVLVVAGGASGGIHHAGGGGAGGLIYRPGFSVTPGGTVSVTVGDGGGPQPSPGPLPHGGTRGTNGSDSVFGTLTAKGGGGGGSSGPEPASGKAGGSGGGASGPGGGSGGSATQPTQSGDSGNYGFGNTGGPGSTGGGGGAGGGGAGAQGAPSGSSAGGGGVGKAYTIGDNTTSVFYAGGGGGGVYQNPTGPGAGGQGGGGRGSATGPDGNTNVVTAGDGTANRGGGGGGSDRSTPSGAGGKGIVIVRWT
jgi:hypothetical protein